MRLKMLQVMAVELPIGVLILHCLPSPSERADNTVLPKFVLFFFHKNKKHWKYGEKQEYNHSKHLLLAAWCACLFVLFAILSMLSRRKKAKVGLLLPTDESMVMLVIHSPPQVVGRTFVIAFGIGITFGFSFAYLLLSSTNGTISVTGLLKYSHHGHHHDQHSEEELGDDHAGPLQDVNLHADHIHRDDDTEARKLQQNVRVLCWVMTGPENHQKKAVHVKKTWGRRCNKLLFMSSVEEPDLPSIKLPVGEGRDNLWGKTKEAFKYVYENHLDDFDWFMKADDDTYVVVENLRYMLSLYNASQPIFFGHKFKPYVKQGYMSGGAGYVLSREALRRFIVEAIGSGDGKTCRTDSGGAEDVEIGKCLQNVGVRAGDSRDEYGRDRFLPFVPEHHLIPGHVGYDFWWWQYIYYPSAEGFNCCADTAISFHYVSPNEMYVLDYLIYHLKPHGIIPERSEGPPPTPPDYDGKATPWVGFKN